jgi:hypothetical protein
MCPGHWSVLCAIDSVRSASKMPPVVVFLVDLDTISSSPFLCGFVRIVAAVDFPLSYHPRRRSPFLASLSVTPGALQSLPITLFLQECCA